MIMPQALRRSWLRSRTNRLRAEEHVTNLVSTIALGDLLRAGLEVMT